MEKYRVLCQNEFYDLLEQYISNSFIRNARKFIKEYFPETAYKIHIRANSEYNDSMYDLNPVVIVLDKENKELKPKEEFSSSTVAYDIWGKHDIEDQQHVDDFTFYMDTPREIPKLFIRIEDGKKENN